MAKTTRVHLLADELGVTSKAIIDKCQAENLDIRNHMSTISAGLAATIREWFSEGDHRTTLETAGRVDLEKVRVRRRRAGKKAEEEQAAIETTALVAEVAVGAEVAVAPGEALDAAVAHVEAPVEPPAVASAGATDVMGAPEAGEAVAVVPAETPVQQPEPVVAAAVAPEAAPVEPPPVVEPPRPEPIKPAGPMLEKPRPAQVTGPRVVRMESVEPEERFPRRPRSPRVTTPRGRSGDAPAPKDVPVIPGTGAGKGRKVAETPRGRKKAEPDETAEDRRKSQQRRMRARDLEDRQARLAAASGEGLRARPSRRIESRRAGELHHIERPATATLTEPITVKNLSAALAAKSGEIMAKLLEQGIMATANQVIPIETAEMIALELGTELTVERRRLLHEEIDREFSERPRLHLQRRPPVVAMLGHVDHGKTSLLDKIRSTRVAAGEAGGITQHIGAYQVVWKDKRVTFLDTPGHEAFTALRARGANMTDIVVLVVAADDGVMPQTIEAIHHAKAAGVTIVVALNKIDLPGVDIHRIYGQLSEQGLTPAEWSGDTEIVKTSAVTGQGIDDLLEHLDYIAELKDLQADPTLPATGWVIEAQMSNTRGAVATVLVKEGVLRRGDMILAGGVQGRVRTIRDSRGRTIQEASCSMPVEISGLSDVPQAGDKFFCLDDANRAKLAAEEYQSRSRERSLSQRSRVTLENLFSQIEAGNIKELNLIVKADVQGSVDVLTKYLSELSAQSVQVKILHAAVGAVTEGDVVLAEASGAIIIAFNVAADERVRAIAESKSVDMRFYNIIYRITEDLKDAMLGLLEPEYEDKLQGRLVVRSVFKISGVGTVAGCYVSSGLVTKKSYLKLIRGGIVVRDKCSIESLKHFKDDVREVRNGLECGIRLAGFDDIKADDVFEAYEVVEKARVL